MIQLFLGLIFAMAPVMELRAAIPIILDWSLQNNIPYLPFIFLAIILNILTVLVVMAFLEFLHHRFLSFPWYKKLWDRWVHNKLREKVAKLERQHGYKQYLGLLLFIALPLPGTGVWTSTTISWLLGMDKKRSFITIAIGAAIAGMIIFFVSLGILPHLRPY